ncbi:hypothetical protein AZE42_12322 [Rhizopogon vesiculosus]|uniref:Uncharacterized protein n=1 Tax=Rhizopogon vesiculosus TaxID=180088 RepID=A0A1J8Q2N7_9AGAM|nr:hypothetical protein AZE42_12322 [Rhizopogon vesiculosus]
MHTDCDPQQNLVLLISHLSLGRFAQSEVLWNASALVFILVHHASPAVSHASCAIVLYPRSSSPFSPEPSQLQEYIMPYL